MKRMSARIAIVGGGLSGLVAAYRLHQAGIGFSLFEARSRFGGRILSVGEDEQPAMAGFDLGPSWFWPDMQPELAALAAELGVRTFAQATEGDMMFERSARETPQRYPAMPQGQRSIRFVGGTIALIAKLLDQLPAEHLHLKAPVSSLVLEGRSISLRSGNTDRVFDRVIMAMPPRLIEHTVTFSPAMSDKLARRWRETATWMAPHAKLVAIYDRPFWLDRGLSGSAQSLVGPLVEIHDATTSSGRAALFGFVGVPAQHRTAAGRDAILEAAVAQLGRLFGPDAARPLGTLYKDWAADAQTATAADGTGSAHLTPVAGDWIDQDWLGRLFLAGSEVSTTEPGYLAGAVQAAQSVVKQVLASLDTNTLKKQIAPAGQEEK
ncbi:MAG: amine oxidase [Marivivens sp.]|nr:amine oxidase [Marivivens sp.]NCW68776.1 amine oxidase [Marivivens sp.]NDH02885.1 amine oxidase [Marivivens sp.]